MKASTLLLAAVFLLPCGLVTTAQAAPPPSPGAIGSSSAVIREDGAIYLEDLIPKSIKVVLPADAPVYYHSDLERFLGTMRKGQTVELQAVGADSRSYRIRGQAQQGQVAGWVEPKFLPLKREFLETLKQNAARQRDVSALIARNEVAVNMTPDEVVAALGKPSRKSSRLDAGGRQEIWEFIKYERVPQTTTGYDQYGRVVSSLVYVRVPAGKLSVIFADNLVTSLEQTEGSPAHDARVKIINAPLNVSL